MLVDLKSDLKKLKFSQFGVNPAIVKDINNPPKYNAEPLQAGRRIDDLVRITKFVASANGLKFVAKQGLLSQINQEQPGQTRKEKLKAAVKAGAISAAKVLGSTLAQVPVTGTGVHFIRGFGGYSYLTPGVPSSPLPGVLGAIQNFSQNKLGLGGGVNGSSSTSAFLNLGTSPGGMGLFASSGGGTSSGIGGVVDSSSLMNSFASLGNGFSTSGGGDNNGSSKNPSFDLNDFPSLGGGVGGGSVGSGTTGSSAGDNGLAAALRQQQQLLQQQMMQGGGNDANAAAAKQQSSNLYRLAMSSNIGNGAGSNFTMATEDFPALPGAAPGEGGLGGLTSEGGGGGGGQPPNNEGVSLSGSGGLLDSGSQLDYTGLIGGVSGATSGVSTTTGNSGSSSLGPTRSTTITQAGRGGASSASGHAGSAIGGDYGLLGLLSVIRMTDADRNRLALGSDLTLLGLNLNSSDNLYSTFGGPFSDKPATREPHYQVSFCICLEIYIFVVFQDYI